MTNDLFATIKHFRFSIDSLGVASLVIDSQNSKANTLSRDVLEELDKILNVIKTEKSIKLLVIKSAKDGIFVAGAEINEINDIKTIDDARSVVFKGQSIISKISSLPFKTFAVINGACMGGGLELALACNYRVLIDTPKTKLALPEVSLGIIPGFGGTQRMPKLIGLINSLSLILTGKQVDPKKALKIGLCDDVIPNEFSEERLKAIVAKIIDGSFKVKRRYFVIQKILKPIILYKAKKDLLRQTKGFYPAPVCALRVVGKTFGLVRSCSLFDSFNFKLELGEFCKLVVTDTSKNLIRLFFINEKLKKESGIESGKIDDYKLPEQALVLGAGVMGGGIAWMFSKIDVPVRMKDISLEGLGLGYKQIFSIYKQIEKAGKVKKDEIGRKFNLVTATVSDEGLEKCDFVVEAIVEDLEIKKKVLSSIEKKLNKDAIIATNTSSLLVSDIAEGIEKKDRFVGMHFFNPVNKMPLVEVIRGKYTSDRAVYSVMQIAKKAGKTPIPVGDCSGFVVNRILLPYMNEALLCLEQYGNIKKIDKIFTDFGLPMGPFTLADEVGIDVCYKVAKNLHLSYGDRMKVANTLVTMYNDLKLLGKKAGKGFYHYKASKKSSEKLIQGEVNKNVGGLFNVNEPFNEREIFDRCIIIMYNEAQKILKEGIIQNEEYLDMAMILGMGFPPFRGGLMRFCSLVGNDVLEQKRLRLQAKYGARFSA